MTTVQQQALKEVAQRNQSMQERRSFVERAAMTAMQGLLSNPANAGIEASALAEKAHAYARALADRLLPTK